MQPSIDPDQAWRRSGARCCLGVIIAFEILLAFILLGTEVLNILVDFWHTNVFGGIWASVVIFVKVSFLCGTVCCMTISLGSHCAVVWNLITLLTLGALITFDVIFLLNPSTCLLTPSCSTQAQLISLTSIIQLVPFLKSYSSSDLKHLFLLIQVICAGVIFLLSFINLIVLLIAKSRIHQRVNQGYPVPIMAYHPGLQIPSASAPPGVWKTPN